MTQDPSASTPPPLGRAGDIIDGTYAIERFLAGGAMGEVYVARDERLGRRVALKLMRSSPDDGDSYGARFQREARALSRLTHPNIVTIHGFGRYTLPPPRGNHAEAPPTNSGWYIAMEYVEGESLVDVLEREGRLSLEETVTLTRQIASGLAEAHAAGLVHRDIKPGNILLRRLASGTRLAKVADFGLARSFDGPALSSARATTVGVVGTPWYMSPEQCQAEPLDGRSDLYSLAVLVYQCLTGLVPFPGDNVPAVLLAQVTDPPPPLPTPDGAPPWPPEIVATIDRALAKDPADRPTDVIAFAEDLAAAAGLGRARHAHNVTCPTCGDQADASHSYCGACGGALPATTCPACSAPRDGTGLYCVWCGTPLLPSRRRLRGDQAGREALHTVRAVALIAHLSPRADPETTADFTLRAPVIIEREAGRALALVGREALGVFGVAGLAPRDTEAAIDAALAITNAFGEDAVTVAVSVGELATRGVGTAWGTAFAWGPAVEQARETISHAHAGGVWVDEPTYRKIRDTYATRTSTRSDGSPGPRRVRRRKRVDIHPSTLARRDVDLPLVGRDLELQQILLAAQTVQRSGQLHVVPVVGAAGMGKSRLLVEVGRRLEDSGVTWWWDAAHVPEGGQGGPYEPFAEMLRARLALTESIDPEDVTRQLLSLPGLANADVPFETFRRRVSTLGRLLGLARHSAPLRPAPPGRSARRPIPEPSTGTARPVSPKAPHVPKPARPSTDAERFAAFDVYAAYVQTASASAPMVILIEDLQWASKPTLELLGHVARAAADSPVLLLLSMRPEATRYVLGTIGAPSDRTIPVRVGPLAEDDLRTLARELHGGKPLPSELLDPLLRFADGVPLRLEEAYETAVERGTLREGEVVDPRRSLILALDTASVDDVIRERLQAMAPSDRRLLAAIAVGGSSTPLGMIRNMLGQDFEPTALDDLRERGLLMDANRPRFAGQRELTFRRGLVRELVLTTAPRAELRALHERAAAWLSAWTGPRPVGFGAEIARHYAAAGRDQQAAFHLIEAARQATSAFANATALESYRAALRLAERALASTPEDAAAALLVLDAALGVAELALREGNPAEALTATERAASVLPLCGDARPLAHPRILCHRADALAAADQTVAALGAFSQAIAALQLSDQVRPDTRAVAASPELALALYALARAAALHADLGHPQEAEELLEQAVAVADYAPSTPDVARSAAYAHRARGKLFTTQRRLGEAVDAFDAARAASEAAQDPEFAARALVLKGQALRGAERHAEAHEALAAGAEALASLGERAAAAAGWLGDGLALLGLKQPSEAALVFERAAKLAAEVGAQELEMQARAGAAEACLKMAIPTAARSFGEEALALARKVGDGDVVARMVSLLATVEEELSMDKTVSMSGAEFLDKNRSLYEKLGLPLDDLPGPPSAHGAHGQGGDGGEGGGS